MGKAKDQFGFHLHKDVRNDPPDFGPGMTWCEHCKAVYNTPKWWKGCKSAPTDGKGQP